MVYNRGGDYMEKGMDKYENRKKMRAQDGKKLTGKKLQTADMMYIALSAALITVCAWISIPAAVPFTLQTFAVCMTAGLLGLKRGTLTIIVYLLMGAVGLPVFTGFRGGLGAIFGTTGGYLAGFILTAFMRRILCRSFRKETPCPNGVDGPGDDGMLCFRHGLVYVSLHKEYRTGRRRDCAGLVCHPVYYPGSAEDRCGLADRRTTETFCKIKCPVLKKCANNCCG